MTRSRSAIRHFEPLVGLGLLTLLFLRAPRGVVAEARTLSFADPWPAHESPQERAWSGGIVRLRAPRSLMARVAECTFTMGSSQTDVIAAVEDCRRSGSGCNEESYENEIPPRRVSLKSYFLDQTEVTVAAYERCVELGRCRAVVFD